jgi:hypothetical protein
MTQRLLHRLARPAALVAGAALLATALLGCTTGTPAAPEGSKIFLSFAYVPGSQDFSTGEYEAVVQVRVLDSVSDVPQTGVGVFFRVTQGPGSFVESGSVRTTNDGTAQNVLVASGEVTLVVSSGATEAELTLNVNSGTTTEDQFPEACFTVDVNGTRVTVDVGCSSDEDCSDDEPDTFTVDWGDGTVDSDLPFSQGDVEHVYSPGDYDIDVSVTDCQNLTDTAPTRSITVT